MPRNEGEIIKRIFVSLTANVELSNEEAEQEDELKGCSFYTGLASLDEALDYINKVRERAYGDAEHNVWKDNSASDADFLQFILDERARELYHEGYRRTDLIRFGQFTTNKYIWQWKGGTHDGQAVDSKYNIYPIPNTELTANPNLHNDNY
jgi:hypothetical protein